LLIENQVNHQIVQLWAADARLVILTTVNLNPEKPKYIERRQIGGCKRSKEGHTDGVKWCQEINLKNDLNIYPNIYLKWQHT